METFFIYLFKTTICLSVFYLIYKILLARDTFFALNRIVLLLGISISFLLPLITVKVKQTTFVVSQLQNIAFLNTTNNSTETNFIEHRILTDATISVQNPKTEAPKKIIQSIPWLVIFGSIYFLGLSINCVVLLVSFCRMRNVIKDSIRIERDNFTYYVTQENINPFSWGGKYIVVSQNEQEGIDSILLHEQVHCKRAHWVDILVVEFLTAFHWFNPLVWKIKQELKDVHEYQVDQDVVKSGLNAINYQLLIVKKAVGSSSYALANSFNHSKIKKRITMMFKQKSPNRNKFKVLVFVPLASMAIYVFSATAVNSMAKDREKTLIYANDIAIVNDSTLIEKYLTDSVYHRPVLDKDLKRVIGYGTLNDPIYKVPKHHAGDDYVANKGTNIYAVKSGVVTLVESGKTGYGFHLIIDHGNGVETLYAHNQENLVKVGDKVEMGQVIALVGNTGKSTGPHLHFEIRKDGKDFDPRWFMLTSTKCIPINDITQEYLKSKKNIEKESKNSTSHSMD